MSTVFTSWLLWSTVSLGTWLMLSPVWATRPTLGKWLWRLTLPGLAAGLLALYRGDECEGFAFGWAWIPLVAAGLSLVFLIGQWRRMRRQLTNLREISAPPFLESLARSFGWRRRLVCFESATARSPFVFDDGRAALVVPAGFAAEDFAPHALAHELAHLREGDGLWFWLESLFVGFLFFHPLVWVARTRARRLTEKSADELVLRKANFPASEFRKALLHFAGKTVAPPAVAFSAAYYELEDRLLSMDRYPRTGSASPLAFLIAGATLLGAWPAQTAWRTETVAVAMCVSRPAGGVVDDWVRASRTIVPASLVR